MTRCRRLLTAALAALAVALPGSAGAAEAQADSVFVDQDPSPWHARNSFVVRWDISPPPAAGQAYPVRYRIRDPNLPFDPVASPIETSDYPTFATHIPASPGSVDPQPGSYLLELWLDDGSHQATATLRFDNQPPAAASPVGPAGWIQAGKSATISVKHPAPPLPASGIRGYAFVLDHGSGASPCAGPDSCSSAETDLRGGADGDSFETGPLREGTNIVRLVAVSNSGMRSRQMESAELHVDGTAPQLALSGVPDDWANGPVEVSATATDALSGMAPAGAGGPYTGLSIDGAAPKVALGGEVATIVHGEGVHVIAATARDAVGNELDGDSSPAPAPSALVRIDESAPRLAFAAQDEAEPERIVATVADALSGPAPRGTIAIRPAGSGQPFQPLPTQASAGRLTASWDSDAYPAGSYEFRATGFDRAGNATSTSRRADGSPMVLSNPIKTPSEIAFGFGGRSLIWHRCSRGAAGVRCQRQVIRPFIRRPVARTVASGRGVPVGGRLTSAAGAPLGGLEVEVSETFAAGALPERRTTTVATGADGVFLAHLAPGPSRRVSVEFAGTPLLTHTVGRALELGVRTGVRLRSSAASATVGGAPVIFSGAIGHDEAAIPATGLAVELQFRLPGLPWSEFRTVQTDAFGRFKYPYAFSDDDSRGVRFQFRAHVPAQAEWPYEPGTSRPVAVTGR